MTIYISINDSYCLVYCILITGCKFTINFNKLSKKKLINANEAKKHIKLAFSPSLYPFYIMWGS